MKGSIAGSEGFLSKLSAWLLRRLEASYLKSKAAEPASSELFIVLPETDRHGHQTVAGLRRLLDGYPFAVQAEDSDQGGLRLVITKEAKRASGSRIDQAWAVYYGQKRSAIPRIGWLFLLAAGVTMVLSAGHSIPGIRDVLQALNSTLGR